MQNYQGCILIPAYNEEKSIFQIVEQAGKFLPVIVIDDGSKDNTAQLAQEAGAAVYKQNPNQGKGAALIRGFKEALNLGYDFLITMDADGQHDPDELPKFIDQYQQTQADLIIGYRDFSKMPFVRKMANSFGGAAFSWAMGQKIIDNQSGYRLMRSRLLLVVLDSSEQGFEFEVEVIVRCIQAGFLLDWVPIRTIYAGESSHIKPVKHFLNFMRVVFDTKKRMSGG